MTPAISVNQPWCGLLAIGLKPIENRDWSTRYRGPVLLHTGRTIDRDAWDDITKGIHPVTNEPMDQAVIRAATDAGAFATGGIVGEAEVVDCVTCFDSSWFVGRYGFVMTNARLTPFRPCKGALGFFTPDFDSRYVVRAPKVPIERPAKARGTVASPLIEGPGLFDAALGPADREGA